VTADLPTTAVGSGLIVRSGGVLNVVARGAGVVQAIDATVGQHVAADQIIARIGQPVLSEHVRTLRDSLDQIARKRQQSLQLKRDEVAMRLTALAAQRANIERSIAELTDQGALAADQIPVMEQLFAKGLVTNQQVIAARQRRVELLGQASDRRGQLTQLESQELELRNQTTTLDQEMQFDLASRQREIATAASELAFQETVTTPYSGDVLEIKVSPGGTVAAGTPILSIQPDSSAIEALIYVSAMQAKDIRVGMDARVSPSTVKREEYGFLQGKVSFVADYPATAAAVMRNFQNEQLVQALTAGGPITEVHVALERDAATTSGFKWSSRGGPPVKISAGTFAIIEVVTRTRAPISLVVPILREKLGL
jgi:HlyD family secretion protein